MTSDPQHFWPPREQRVILTLLADKACSPLSPFYALTPWIGLADLRGRIHRVVPAPACNADDVTKHIIACRPRLLITGFVPDAACAKLLAAGIDVRVGPCSEPAVALVQRYGSLPMPNGTHEWTCPATQSLRRQ